MAVYDVFTFNDELEMLLVRLVEHNSFVDNFVLIQGDKTFTGKPKPLHFPFHDKRFDPFLEKIIVRNVILDKNPQSPWDNELKQRNASFFAFPIQPADLILLSDVDEIVSRRSWPSLLKRMEREEILSVWMELFNFYINLRIEDATWLQPKLIRGDTILRTQRTANDFRVDYSLPKTESWCGWHFSYVMEQRRIVDKIQAVSHQEHNRPIFTDLSRVQDQLKKRRDLFKRGLKLNPVPVTSEWPLQMVNDPYWKQFICTTEPIKSSFSDTLSDFFFWAGEYLVLTKNNLKRFVKQVLNIR